MRRIFFLICTALCASMLLGASPAGAQWRPGRSHSPRQRSTVSGVEYHNFSLTRQTIDLAGENTLLFAPTLHGIAFTSGHNFMVHERPLLRVVHFGFDVTWFDFEYARWRQRVEGRRHWMHKIDASIGVGPALHISPARKVGFHLYGHYNPTLSVVTHNFAGDEDGKFELVAGYASYFSAGLSLSWDAFSIGGEYRHGGGTYRGIKIPDVTVSLASIDELLDLQLKDALDKQRHTMRGWRAYVSFRF